MIKSAFLLVLKGVAVGAANVIPGLSGGTIALITGIFERLIHAIKSFNFYAIKLLFLGRIKEFVKQTDFIFLALLGVGMIIAVVTVARLFDVMFNSYPVYIWAFFFGLILISIFYIGKNISRWGSSSVIASVVGASIALGITFLNPAQENDNIFFIMAGGAVAMCSMILPGLSGSFVLIIMGNYQLIAIDAINGFRLEILIPFFLGAGIGLVSFAHILSWIYKKYRDTTLALLTGFVAGSLGVLYPWKKQITEFFGGKEKVVGYDWYLPSLNTEFFIAMLLMISGMLIIIVMEHQASKNKIVK